MAENEQHAKSTPGQYFKEFKGEVNLGQMALKQAGTNSFWEQSSGHQGLLQLL